MKKNIKDIKNKKEIISKISSQNEDTGIPSYNAKDAKPYERKNMPIGFYNKYTGEK